MLIIFISEHIFYSYGGACSTDYDEMEKWESIIKLVCCKINSNALKYNFHESYLFLKKLSKVVFIRSEEISNLCQLDCPYLKYDN